MDTTSLSSTRHVRRRSYLAATRSVVARRTSYPHGHRIAPHLHPHAQFLFALSGTMAVRTPRTAWIVPPSRALWIPAHTVHAIEMTGVVEMRSVYVDAAYSAGMPSGCVVFEVTALLRELIVRAAALPQTYGEQGDEALLMRLLVAEIRHLPPCALDLPLPASADIVRLCEHVMQDLSVRRVCADEAIDLQTSARTLSRRFLRETGITFARWKQQARLLEAVRRLGAGTPVTHVALDLGYASVGAFSTMFRRTIGAVPRTFLPATTPMSRHRRTLARAVG